MLTVGDHVSNGFCNNPLNDFGISTTVSGIATYGLGIAVAVPGMVVAGKVIVGIGVGAFVTGFIIGVRKGIKEGK